MEKIDHKKTLKEFYNPPRMPVIVDVPEWQFLMIDGKGYPGTSQEYQDALEALYAVAYTLRFALKKAEILDYKVMPLEGSRGIALPFSVPQQNSPAVMTTVELSAAQTSSSSRPPEIMTLELS